VNIVIFDMSLLEFRRVGGRLAVHAPAVGELLSVPAPADLPSREAVFDALDELLRSFELPLADGWCRAGLYNPISRQVAVGPVPDTLVFDAVSALRLDAFGTLAEIEGDTLVVGARRIERLVPSMRSTQAVLAAH